MARCVCALSDEETFEHMCSTTEPSAKCWIFKMMEFLSHEEFIKILVTLWEIWTARIAMIFVVSLDATHTYMP
jgi:hypothetical protein